MSEKQRKDAAGEENKIKAKPEWSIVSVQGIIDNDFYIGTFRQAKYTRRKLKGKDLKPACTCGTYHRRSGGG